MFAAVDPSIWVALIGLPSAMLLAITGVWTYRLTKRNDEKSSFIAQETLDLTVIQTQVDTFKILGEQQASAIEQRDREIGRLETEVSRLQQLVNFYREREQQRQQEGGK